MCVSGRGVSLFCHALSGKRGALLLLSLILKTLSTSDAREPECLPRVYDVVVGAVCNV